MYLTEHGEDNSKKVFSLTIVILIHALVLYFLLTGLGKQLIFAIKEEPIEAKLIEEVKPPPPPPPPEIPHPHPKVVTPPKAYVPRPEIQIKTPPVTNAITAVTAEKPPQQEIHVEAPAAKAVGNGPSVTRAVVDFSTCNKPEYPTNSLLHDERGTVRLKFLIGADGHVADSTIERSSGYSALDRAAQHALSLCRFKPGTVDGVPQQSWTEVDYLWKLPD